ncbi:serine hydroxymethyltransferase [Candidatus Peregrinibacteria bacterium]|jgi:glycine hydroxymethyltransferase|nr:serine hydroxymethyltransferase [Candidatus Peregrinibacteria bacterium]MBT4148360.1 serine hydroxymethyltransferase [Candidatus Peregrinibacteria bacterium]MBT4366673.1 serine hydroxymethyltransferase [Candidatus Peregrinibacteria bacterium]MBT4455887.1 serine hydroxymethyltransferase [Candidatus Peregrinibacteria bacterium]
MSDLKTSDPKVAEILEAEMKRQAEGIELIPSENYVSQAVLEANGSIFTNKYSEGYPGKRYYGGQENTDRVENLAIERAKELFGAEHANVQPYSGSPANTAIYFALLEFGDTVMGLKLDHGGHITHGLPIAFSGKAYNFVQYEVDKETGALDYDEIEKLAVEHKPKMIVAGFTAYPRDIDWKRFKEIADKVGAISFADISHTAGLIAGKALESPVPYFDIIMTTTHKTLRGPRGAIILCKEKYAKAINRAVFPGLQGGPHEHIIAAKAVAFGEALKPEFQEYAAQVITNARHLAEKLTEHGFELVSGGTDTHLILVDLTNKNVPGKQAQVALDKVGITLNKNTVPFDQRSPFDPSGIRLGTPAVTTRGMKEPEMEKIAGWIKEVIDNIEDEDTLTRIKKEVEEMCAGFPVPGIKV